MLAYPDETDVEKVITVKKQMMFATQIAYGMVVVKIYLLNSIRNRFFSGVSCVTRFHP